MIIHRISQVLLLLCLLCTTACVHGFGGRLVKGPFHSTSSRTGSKLYVESTRQSQSTSKGTVDSNRYNVPLETAAELWTVSVSADNAIGRPAGIPFLEASSKDYFVDDVSVLLERNEGEGLGIDLLELAGGREDGYGLTIVQGVSGNAEAAGILPGDSIASVEIRSSTTTSTAKASLESEENVQVLECECLDFDRTIDQLTSIPADANTMLVQLKRIRRWPRIQVIVEYPPSQCAPGVDNTETLSLFAGENLRRALLNRKIVMEDPLNKKPCDFCGGKCTVKVEEGMELLNDMSTTEEKIMRRNPKCRLSCKAIVGPNMQEGNLRIKINLNEWNRDRDGK